MTANMWIHFISTSLRPVTTYSTRPKNQCAKKSHSHHFAIDLCHGKS